MPRSRISPRLRASVRARGLWLLVIAFCITATAQTITYSAAAPARLLQVPGKGSNVVATATHQLTPEQQAQMAAQARATRRAHNRLYLERSRRQYAVCPPSSGAGTSQSFSSGTTLSYDVPTANGAFLERFIIVCNLTVNVATTGGTPALNKGGALSLFDSFEVDYNGTQDKLRPLFLKYLELAKGYQRPFGTVIAGQSIAARQNVFYSSFGVAAGNNTWSFYVPFDLRTIAHSAAGMLPIMGDSTRAQIKLACAGTVLGNDPISNAVSIAGGSANSVTVSGTVQVIAVYTDGVQYPSHSPLSIDLNGEPTVVYSIDRQINPLSSGIMTHSRIDRKLQHYTMLSIIVDGQQASDFALDSNIQGIELNEDYVGTNHLAAFGVTSSNLPMALFHYENRRMLGQDLDQGVILWTGAAVANQVNPSNREGSCVLNMLPGGWTDLSIGVQVANTGSPLAGVTPRVETYLVSLDPAGLTRA